MLDPTRKRFLIALCLINGLVALDSTIVATALPKIVESLAGARDYTWVVTGYLISSSVVMPVTGRLADLVAPRRLIYLGTLLFLGGSLLAQQAVRCVHHHAGMPAAPIAEPQMHDAVGLEGREVCYATAVNCGCKADRRRTNSP